MNLKNTNLYDIHLALNAKMCPFAGFQMPIQYNSVKDEVAFVRNKAGVFDVSHMGEFFVKGKDAISFVDYLITNDFKNSPLNKAVYSPLCREDGTIIDDLIAYKLGQEEVLLCVNASNIDKDWNWINQNKDNFDVILENASEDYSLIALQGPDSEKILNSIGLLPLTNQDKSNLTYYSVQRIPFEGEFLILARTGYTGEDGFEVFVPNQYVKKIWNMLTEKGAHPCGLGSRDVLRLEVCFPLYGNDLNDDLTPLDTGLKWTVKFSKPSFIGKKFLETYSPIYQQIKLSLKKGIPRKDYSIFNSEGLSIGVVTSGTISTTLGKGICLALVKKSLYPKDAKFLISIRKDLFEAEIHNKPFFSGGHK
jgi:aminomethyltransferase